MKAPLLSASITQPVEGAKKPSQLPLPLSPSLPLVLLSLSPIVLPLLRRRPIFPTPDLLPFSLSLPPCRSLSAVFLSLYGIPLSLPPSLTLPAIPFLSHLPLPLQHRLLPPSLPPCRSISGTASSPSSASLSLSLPPSLPLHFQAIFLSLSGIPLSLAPYRSISGPASSPSLSFHFQAGFLSLSGIPLSLSLPLTTSAFLSRLPLPLRHPSLSLSLKTSSFLLFQASGRSFPFSSKLPTKAFRSAQLDKKPTTPSPVPSSFQ